MNHTVFRYSNPRRPFYVVRWKNGPPGMESGERSTKQKSRRKAESWAATFIASIEAGDEIDGSLTWKSFRQAFRDQRLPQLASPGPYETAMNQFDRLVGVKLLREVDADAFVRFSVARSKRGLAKASQASYAKHLRAALGWAEGQGMIRLAPTVKTGQTDRMRGRPLTMEEFERMLAITQKVVGKRNVAGWHRVLIGAWAIGLRRAEFLRVEWDRDDRIHILGLNAGTARIVFPADQHKAKRDMVLPLLPEAADMLRMTTRARRSGPVFLPLQSTREVQTADSLGRVIGRIGKAAKVVTEIDPETRVPRYATLHDLRRSLGTRLAHTSALSMPEVAQMMRHRKIETTMAHYADLQVGTLGEKLSEISSCILGCTPSGSLIPEPRPKSLQ